jgi:hypothetical protein
VAEDLIQLIPGTTPAIPNIRAIIGSGDPSTATRDADLTGAAVGSIFIRRDGIPGAFLYTKTESPNTWQVNDRLFDVKAYGASGDGRSDDTAALNRALAAAGATSGTVYVPPGSYRLGGTLNVPAHTALQLAGGATLEYSGATHAIALGAGGAIRGQCAAASVIRCTRGATGVLAASHALVTDVTIAGTATGGQAIAGAAAGVESAPVTDIVVQRSVLTGFQDGVYSGAAAQGWSITDTRIAHIGRAAILLLRRSTGFIISNNYIIGAGASGIEAHGDSHVMSHNWLGGPGSAGEGIVLASHSCLVSGNRIDGFAGTGIALVETDARLASDNLVTGNIVTNCGGDGCAIHANGTGAAGAFDRNAIMGNIFRNNARNGILLSGDGAHGIALTLIANNLITRNGGGPAVAAGIMLDGPDGLADSQVLHNIVVDNHDPGSEASQIVIRGTTRTTIVGNKTERSDNTYRLVNTMRTPATPTLQVLNTAGGPAVVSARGAAGSAFTVTTR